MNQSFTRINQKRWVHSFKKGALATWVNEHPLKWKTHESFSMVINFSIVNFIAMVQGHQFSMNYRTVFYTTHEKRFSWPWKFLLPSGCISCVIKYVSRSVKFMNIPVLKFMGHEMPVKSLQTSVIPSHAK